MRAAARRQLNWCAQKQRMLRLQGHPYCRTWQHSGTGMRAGVYRRWYVMSDIYAKYTWRLGGHLAHDVATKIRNLG